MSIFLELGGWHYEFRHDQLSSILSHEQPSHTTSFSSSKFLIFFYIFPLSLDFMLHLSIDALDQDNTTCCVTTCTYSRPLLALKALVRYRKTYGQYHASARPLNCQYKISTHSCRPVPAYIPRNRRCARRGTLSLWSILLCLLWIIPLDILVKGIFHITSQ